MSPQRYLHALNTIPGVTPQGLRALLEHFDTPEAIWKASPAAIRASGIKEKTTESIITSRPRIDIEKTWSKLGSHDISVVIETDPQYPSLLKEIPTPPPILYKRGAFDLGSKPFVTIVGSRHSTPYGEQVARSFAGQLVTAGICVASGLAFGIDSAAHQGVLEAHGDTVAVLGNGLDDTSVSPKAQLSLATSIVRSGGALLSEYPPGTSATPYTFPARNRILAGMSLGTVVIEAAEKSGSLITARYALEFNREVFAVPGSIFSEASQGPHALIRSGAKIATNISDILEELRPQLTPAKNETLPSVILSPEEKILFDAITREPAHIDKILKTTTLDTSTAHSALVFLEMKGVVKNIGGMHYIRT